MLAYLMGYDSSSRSQFKDDGHVGVTHEGYAESRLREHGLGVTQQPNVIVEISGRCVCEKVIADFNLPRPSLKEP